MRTRAHMHIPTAKPSLLVTPPLLSSKPLRFSDLPSSLVLSPPRHEMAFVLGLGSAESLGGGGFGVSHLLVPAPLMGSFIFDCFRSCFRVDQTKGCSWFRDETGQTLPK